MASIKQDKESESTRRRIAADQWTLDVMCAECPRCGTDDIVPILICKDCGQRSCIHCSGMGWRLPCACRRPAKIDYYPSSPPREQYAKESS